MEETAPESEFQEPPPSGVVCPNCGQTIDPSAIPGPVIECPQCGTQFFPPAPTGDELSDEEKEVEETKATMQEQLSSLRIKQFSTLRRTAYRTRSYLIIGAAGCAWFTIPLVITIVKSVREKHHWGMGSSAEAMLVVASLIGAYKFGIRAVEVQRGIEADLRARELEELEAAKREPDLSALSDGSQYAKALEQMYGKPKEESSTKDTKGHEAENG